MNMPTQVLCGEDCGQLSNFSDAQRIVETGATLGEIRSKQLAAVRQLGASSVIIALGYQDILNGCDESFYHAEVVALADELLELYAPQQLAMLAIPELPSELATEARIAICQQCNGAARNVAELRRIRWVESLS